MAIVINPFTGQLDIAGGGGSLPTIGAPVVGADPNAILITDGSANLQDITLDNGELLIGSTGAAPVATTLTGTADQVIVTNGAGTITLSLPQSVNTTSSPTFDSLTLTNPLTTANGGTGVDTAANGELLIGNGTGFTLATLTGTSDQVTVTNGSGTITLALPQSIATTSSPQFANIVLTPAGSLDITAAGGTLAIGTTNADTINIGNSGATVNIQGTTFYQNVTDLVVTDKNIVINSGGSAGSASNAGISVEENAIITAYVDTSADRNSWEFKAPAQTGVVTISPGASGFTIDQGSHNPVTIGTANGLSLSTQALSLQLATTAQNGALSSTDWNTFDGKQDALTFGDVTSTDIDVTGGTGAIIGAGVDLTLADVNLDVGTFANATITVNAKGLITAASATAQNNVFQDNTFEIDNAVDPTKRISFDAQQITPGNLRAIIMADFDVNLGGLVDANIAIGANIDGAKIVVGTGNTAVVTDLNGNLTPSTTTDTEIGYVSGVTSSIQTQLNDKQDIIVADIPSTTWTGLANNTTNQVITGFLLDASAVSFEGIMRVFIDATTDTYTTIKVLGTKTATDWNTALSSEVSGDTIPGLAMNITTAGQVRISVGNITGFSSGEIKFRAISVT